MRASKIEECRNERTHERNSMKPAKGVRGCIINSFNGNYYFRVYNPDHSFVDYDLHHCDLSVIVDDDDAVLYDDKQGQRLDHSPATLGIKEE
jgi:hypothetical protein